ncbi:hypothetical protein ACQP1O_43000 (plasmid) [Nocardia sp. CA-151230]|uniref:hypothetical protein n=1 Tax=Nocardia sp. CA-151230 TaxID=3239982 RepID=UPI003D8AAE06
MTIVEGSYLLWFARHGHLTFQQMDCVEDAIELVVRLRHDSTTTAEYDQYGSACDLERVGHGIVEGFFDLCDEREEQNAREWQARQEARARERAAKPGPRYAILLSPPEGMEPHLWRGPEYLTGDLDGEQVIVERDRLEALVGRDRITVRQTATAEEGPAL